MSLTDTDFQVINVVQSLPKTDGITREDVISKVRLACSLSPEWQAQANEEAIVEEILRRAKAWIGEDVSLVNTEGHEPWLTHERKKEWRYWQRYRQYQEQKLSWNIVEGLDKSADHILSCLEDPNRDGPWDRRGLVVGHVQSGKTGSYTGLICKAADAGYKVIIVLAGMHNNLRSQTQIRLDEGFLGFTTSPVHDAIQITGVGHIDSDPFIRPNFATTRLENGDFNLKMAKTLGVSPEQRPWLFVVKKNKSVLTSLLKWIRDHVANTHDKETGRKLVSHLPLLMIDDEADNASVDTGDQPFDELGQPDVEHEPTAINRLTRQILHTFTRKAYVGYTATPFANIFIHERGVTEQEGPDLFPSAFICNLSASSSYIGPAKIFGLATEGLRSESLPLIREVRDYCSEDGKSGWMPPKHKNGHHPVCDDDYGIPNSLREAINAFILGCAIRRLRGQGGEHSSMLIHVTRFTLVQGEVKEQVADYVSKLKQRLVRNIGHQSIIDTLRQLWEKDFISSSYQASKMYPELVTEEYATWNDIEPLLADTVSEIEVRAINGHAKEALDYADNAGGLKVIAIGGDKLARGLTLEGLTVSYFLRASRMYDTLMQMGRWFGYRPGYLDLCRLYTTEELVEWFEHIADASEELREEFDLMVASGATPREYGLKVMSHPVLMVTSRMKMRSSKSLELSFSGQSVETVSMLKDLPSLRANEQAFLKMVKSLGEPTSIPVQSRGGKSERWNGVQWVDVPAERVCDFLMDFKTHPAAMKVNSQMLSEFIREMSMVGELTAWRVAVMGGKQAYSFEIGSHHINLVKRTPRDLHEDRYSIRRLLSPRDEAMDLDENAWKAALELTRSAWHADAGRSEDSQKEPTQPNGPAIRTIRGYGADGVKARPEAGLLLIYLLDPKVMEPETGEDFPPVVSFGISFPRSTSGKTVRYEVNNVLWEQEYGPAY